MASVDLSGRGHFPNLHTVVYLFLHYSKISRFNSFLNCPSPPSWILKISNFNDWYALETKSVSFCQISSRSVDSLPKYDHFFRFFKMAAACRCWSPWNDVAWSVRPECCFRLRRPRKSHRPAWKCVGVDHVVHPRTLLLWETAICPSLLWLFWHWISMCYGSCMWFAVFYLIKLTLSYVLSYNMVLEVLCYSVNRVNDQMAAASNIPIPPAMDCTGDVAGNWEFFISSWTEYKNATELCEKNY